MEDTAELGYHQRRANVVRRASVDQLDSLVAGQVEGHLAMALVSSAKGGRSLKFMRTALEQLLGKGVNRISLSELKGVKVVLSRGEEEGNDAGGAEFEVRFGALIPGTDDHDAGRQAFVDVMLQCLRDKQNPTAGEEEVTIDWADSIFESSEEEFVDSVRNLLVYVSPGGDILLAQARVDFETDRKLVLDEMKNDKADQSTRMTTDRVQRMVLYVEAETNSSIPLSWIVQPSQMAQLQEVVKNGSFPTDAKMDLCNLRPLANEKGKFIEMSEGVESLGKRKQLTSKMQIYKGVRMHLFSMAVLCYDKVKYGCVRSDLPGLTLLGVHSFLQGILEAVHNEGVSAQALIAIQEDIYAQMRARCNKSDAETLGQALHALRVGLIKTLSDADIRYSLAGKEVFVGFADDAEEGKDGSGVVKNVKGDAELHRKLKEVRDELQRKEREIEGLKKENRDLRAQAGLNKSFKTTDSNRPRDFRDGDSRRDSERKPRPERSRSRSKSRGGDRSGYRYSRK